jgi:hypothetical protein
MYLRVDPSKSAGFDLYVLDSNSNLQSLKNNSTLLCLNGIHQNFPDAELKDNQQITCTESDSQIFTLIYKI